MARLSFEEAEFVMAHEVLHCTNNHHTRRGARDLKLFNIAADLVINPILREARIGKPPAGALFPSAGDFNDIPEGLSTEATYARLQESGAGNGAEGDGPGQPSDDPGGCGGVKDAGGAPADLRGSEAEWEVSVAQAYQVAKSRGVLPGCLADLVQKALAPDTSVADYLWEFISRHARNLEVQEDLIRRYFEWKFAPEGYQFDGIIKDPAVSASVPIVQRPGGFQLTQRIDKGDAVVLSKLDKQAGAAKAFDANGPVAFAIAGHHGGIPDRAELKSLVAGASGRAVAQQVWTDAVADCPELSRLLLNPPPLQDKLHADLFTRLVFSCLTERRVSPRREAGSGLKQLRLDLSVDRRVRFSPPRGGERIETLAYVPRMVSHIVSPRREAGSGLKR